MQGQKLENTSQRIEMPAIAEKNILGKLGPKCNYCSGAGFTNSITGASAGCFRCDQTGIEPINTRQLAERVDAMDEKLKLIISLLNK